MLDENVRYQDAYLGEFAYYYQGIFGPFKPYVLAGLDKIEGLDLEAVCPATACFGRGDPGTHGGLPAVEPDAQRAQKGCRFIRFRLPVYPAFGGSRLPGHQ